MGDCPGKGRRHNRRGARRGKNGGNDALQKRTKRPFLGGGRLNTAAAEETRDWNFPDSEQTQRHGKYHGGDCHVERGAAELAAPGEIDRTGKHGEQQEHGNDACRIPDIENQRVAAAAPRLLDKAHDLEADHRQHARHQVENQPANKRQRDVVRERAGSRIHLQARQIIAVRRTNHGRAVASLLGGDRLGIG